MTSTPPDRSATGATTGAPVTRPSIVVIGAGPGIGFAVARRFAAGGHDVGLVARDGSRLRSAAEEIGGEYGVQAAGFSADAGQPAALRQALAAAEDRFGAPAVLHYNLSRTVQGPPSTLDVAAFASGIALGATGFLVALQAVLPGMRRLGRGRVLVTGSIVASSGDPDWVGLSVQKAALRKLALAAAKELAPEGIRVVTVTVTGTVGQPGIDPESIAERFWQVAQSGTDSTPAEVRFPG